MKCVFQHRNVQFLVSKKTNENNLKWIAVARHKFNSGPISIQSQLVPLVEAATACHISGSSYSWSHLVNPAAAGPLS